MKDADDELPVGVPRQVSMVCEAQIVGLRGVWKDF